MRNVKVYQKEENGNLTFIPELNTPDKGQLIHHPGITKSTASELLSAINEVKDLILMAMDQEGDYEFDGRMVAYCKDWQIICVPPVAEPEILALSPDEIMTLKGNAARV